MTGTASAVLKMIRAEKVANLFGVTSAFVEKKRVDYDESVAIKFSGSHFLRKL